MSKDDIFDGGTLQEVTVTGKAPSWFGKTGLYPTRYRFNPNKWSTSRTKQADYDDVEKMYTVATAGILPNYLTAARQLFSGDIYSVLSTLGMTSENTSFGGANAMNVPVFGDFKAPLFLKVLPKGGGRYYRVVDKRALDSYRLTGVISQYDANGNMRSPYEVPMFTKDEPSTYRNNQTGQIFVVSKPEAKLLWEPVKGLAMSPKVNGQFNKAPVSDFEFYAYDPNKGYILLDNNLNLPQGISISETPHVDYLNMLSKEQLVEYLTKNGLNDLWLRTLENNPNHLENVLSKAEIPLLEQQVAGTSNLIRLKEPVMHFGMSPQIGFSENLDYMLDPIRAERLQKVRALQTPEIKLVLKSFRQSAHVELPVQKPVIKLKENTTGRGAKTRLANLVEDKKNGIGKHKRRNFLQQKALASADGRAANQGRPSEKAINDLYINIRNYPQSFQKAVDKMRTKIAIRADKLGRRIENEKEYYQDPGMKALLWDLLRTWREGLFGSGK